MATVSRPRTPADARPRPNGFHGRNAPPRRGGPARYFVAAAVVAGVVLGAVAIALVSTGASLTSDSSALARVELPFYGGKIVSAAVTTGPHSQRIPIDLRDGRIWPRTLVPAGTRVSIEVLVKHPGSIGWLAGRSERLRLSLVTPRATLLEHYVTLRSGAPLRVHFSHPVAAVSFGPAGALQRHLLKPPRSEITLPRTADAGSILVAGAPRSWETAAPSALSWFPTGSAAAAVASPAPGSRINPSEEISLSFSKPVDQALGKSRPTILPATAGSWHQTDSHTLVFRPQGYGYGLGVDVTIALPAGVSLLAGRQSGGSSTGTWIVPPGSTLRLQQLLSSLGYLPLDFHYGGPPVAHSPQAQVAAAIDPPAGTFSWRYGNVPAGLRGMWQPGAAGVMTQGAVMAFENDHGLPADGDAGPTVWRSLIAAALKGQRSTFGYSFVIVDRESSPQSLTLWHSGKSILNTDVNTGIDSAPTDPGTFTVYEHIRVGTMSGTNPDGSQYSDPGIQFISYFNGGDALHAFDRAQFGFPQSLGCVEMSLGPAGQVWPYTPVGTLVHVV